MRLTQLSAVDLNLLPALVALLEEQQVSRAAARVGLSQPAMSRALGRLRLALDDELLVRTPAGYRRTPRAERIQGELAAVLPGLEALFGGEHFDSARAEVSFRLAGSDYAVSVLGATLFARVLRDAPHASLRFDAWHDRVFDEIRSGDVDVAFFGGAVPADLSSTCLFTERFVCVLSDAHPLAGRAALTLEEYLASRHLVIDVGGGGQPAIEEPLRALGRHRTASLVVPYHVAAPRAVMGTELVATLPGRVAAVHATGPGLRVLAAPAEIETMRYSVCWHPLVDRDAAHAWLREAIVAAAPGEVERPG